MILQKEGDVSYNDYVSFPHGKAKPPTAGIGWSKTGSVKMEKVLSEPTTVSFNHIWSKLVVRQLFLFLWHVVL